MFYPPARAATTSNQADKPSHHALQHDVDSVLPDWFRHLLGRFLAIAPDRPEKEAAMSEGEGKGSDRQVP